MYAIRVFYRMDRIPEGWTTIGKWTLSVRFDYMFQAVNYAKMMKQGDEHWKTEYFETHYIPVEVITKEQFYSAKWDEFSEAWNNSVKPDTLNPLEAFDIWIKYYYNYLTAKQYMKIL